MCPRDAVQMAKPNRRVCRNPAKRAPHGCSNGVFVRIRRGSPDMREGLLGQRDHLAATRRDCRTGTIWPAIAWLKSPGTPPTATVRMGPGPTLLHSLTVHRSISRTIDNYARRDGGGSR